MANFSYNQVSHIYVGNKYECPVPDTANSGTVGLKNLKDSFYLDYMGAGGPLRSDIVEKSNILWITATSSEKTEKPLKRVKVTFNSECELEKCAEYFLRVGFRQFQSLGEEDTATKHGVYSSGKNPSKENLLKNVAHSLVNSFARLENPLIKVYVDDSEEKETAGTLTEIKWGSKLSDIKTTVKGIVIEEVEQPWRRGVMAQHPVLFDVYSSISDSTCQCRWAVVNEIEAEKKVKNGKVIADYEHFLMGARGDIYRGVSFPNNIETTYLVDPTKEYDVVTIHYFYQGDNDMVQRSEKDLVIVFPNDGSHTLVNQFIGDLNTATNNKFNIETL